MLVIRTLILSTLLYACESWTLTAEQGKIHALSKAFEYHCKDHATNEVVRNKIRDAVGNHGDLFTKKYKLRVYGDYPRSSGMSKGRCNSAGYSKRGKKKKTEKEMGRHKGFDRTGAL